jgi:hypothetical protein
MAAKGKGRSAGQSPFVQFLIHLTVLGSGVAGGYVWRSYYPLALPIESPLVADRRSDEVSIRQLKELAEAANERAEKAEAERDALNGKLAKTDTVRTSAEHDLGDLQIKTMLSGGSESGN